MTDATCLVCDHDLDGRSRKFCTRCLPPHGEWSDKRGYQRRYAELGCIAGIYDLGLNKCRIPKDHGAYLPKPDRWCACGVAIFGDGKFCGDECAAASRLEQRRRRAEKRADELFPRLDDELTARLDVLMARRADIVVVRQLPKAPEGARCAGCDSPFHRGGGTRYSYCGTCLPKVCRFNNFGIDPGFPPRSCKVCAAAIPGTELPGNRNARFCSDFCRNMSRAKSARKRRMRASTDLVNCDDCGWPSCRPSRNTANRCNWCRFVHEAMRKGINTAKRLVAMSAGDDIDLRDLARRDGWRCHLCGKRVLKAVGQLHPKSPTADHLIPIAAGGTHTWDNVALAHRDCNMRRSDRGNAQLRLVG
jgi:predicted nucleic acid-binding Zn ribbon protein